MRRSVPNWLIRSGCSEPLTFSNTRAGPPALTVRSLIAVISRYGSTSVETRLSSPSRSSRAIQARRSRGGAKARSVYGSSAGATAPGQSSVLRLARLAVLATVPEVLRQLPDRDHRDEDQPDD